MTSIKAQVTGADMTVELTGLLTGGMVGVPVEFSFDAVWDGLIKTAVFRAGTVSKDVVDVKAEAVIPWEVMLQEEYMLQIGVYGCNADGSIVIPTVWADTGLILPGADPSGDPGADPSLPVWQQILLQLLQKPGQTTTDGGEIFCDYENNAAALFGAAFGNYCEALWRSMAGGYLSRANNTSFSIGRLQVATGKGAFCSGMEYSTDVLTPDGCNVSILRPVSIDETVVELDAEANIVVGDYVHFAPVDMPGVKATDVKRVEDVQTVDGRSVLILNAPFRAENYYEGNGVPEDGMLPAGMKLRLNFGNIASGNGSAVLGGRGNKATGDNAVILGGEANEATAWNALAAGWHLIAASAGQAVFGQWNIKDAKGLYAFILGWGTESNPKNIFTVERKGNVKAAGKITAGKDPESDMDLVPLHYLQEMKSSGELTGPQGPKGEQGDPGPENLFIAEYGVTTYAELKAAYEAGKALFCKDGSYFAPLYQKTSGNSFAFYRTTADTVTNAYCSSTGWGKKTTALCDTALTAIGARLDDVLADQDQTKYDFDETYVIAEEDINAKGEYHRTTDSDDNPISLSEMQVDFTVPSGENTGVQYLYFYYEGENNSLPNMRVAEFAYQSTDKVRHISVLLYKLRETFYNIHGYAWTEGDSYTALQYTNGTRMNCGYFFTNPTPIRGFYFNVANGKPIAGTVIRVRGRRFKLPAENNKED